MYAVELVDLHGAALTALAFFLTRDSLVAAATVARVIVAASLDHARFEPARPGLAELSRLTLWACAAPADARDSSRPQPVEEAGTAHLGVIWSNIPARERALLALTMFGGHTYRDAAAVIGVAPDAAADLLRDALHTIGAAHRALRPAAACPISG